MLRRELLKLLGVGSAAGLSGNATADGFRQTTAPPGGIGAFDESQIQDTLASGAESIPETTVSATEVVEEFLSSIIGELKDKALDWLGDMSIDGIIDAANDVLGDVADEFRELADLEFLYNHGQDILDAIAENPIPTTTSSGGSSSLAGPGENFRYMSMTSEESKSVSSTMIDFDVPSPGDISDALGEISDAALEEIKNTFEDAKDGIYDNVDGVADEWSDFKDHLTSLSFDDLLQAIAEKVGDVLTTAVDGLSDFLSSTLSDPATDEIVPSFDHVDADLGMEMGIPASLPDSAIGTSGAISAEPLENPPSTTPNTENLAFSDPERLDALARGNGNVRTRYEPVVPTRRSIFSRPGIPSKLRYFVFEDSWDIAENRSVAFEFGQKVPIQLEEHRCAGAGQLVGLEYTLKWPLTVGEVATKFWGAIGPQPNCLYFHIEPEASLSSSMIMNQVQESQIEKYAIGHWSESILGAYSQELRDGITGNPVSFGGGTRTSGNRWTYETVTAYLNQLYADIEAMKPEIADEVTIDVDRLYDQVGLVTNPDEESLKDTVNTVANNVEDAKQVLEDTDFPDKLQSVEVEANNLGLSPPSELSDIVSMSAPLRGTNVNFDDVRVTLPSDIEDSLDPVGEWLQDLKDNNNADFQALDDALGSAVDLATFLTLMTSGTIPMLTVYATVKDEVTSMLDNRMLSVLRALVDLMEFKYVLEWPFPIPCERLCFNIPSISDVLAYLITPIVVISWALSEAVTELVTRLPDPIEAWDDHGEEIIQMIVFVGAFMAIVALAYSLAAGGAICTAATSGVCGVAIAALGVIVFAMYGNVGLTVDGLMRDNAGTTAA